MKKKHFISKEELENLYYNQLYSQTKIGKIYGCSCGVINQIMQSYSMKIRTKSEAWIIRRQNGEIHTPEGKKRISEHNKGNKYGYRGGRVVRYINTQEMQENRLIALERDDHKCEYCRKYANQTHHLDLSAWNHDLANLMSLCISCHRKLHFHIYRTYFKPYNLTLNDILETPLPTQPTLLDAVTC